MTNFGCVRPSHKRRVCLRQACLTRRAIDGYAASHRAVREFAAGNRRCRRVRLRSSKYLNNRIEADHRNIKARIGPMLSFKALANAAVMIAGIELMHRIRKGQFNLRRLGVKGQAAPAIWNAVLLA